jgi:hypothetical protein
MRYLSHSNVGVRIGFGLAAVATALTITVSASAGQRVADAKPIVISLTDPGGRATTEVGLLYTPDILSRLAAGHDNADVPARVAEAIRRRRPIVVMWNFPPAHGEQAPPRPFHIAIVEAGGDVVGPRIEPVWTAQDAEDLRRLDRSMDARQVGAMAAFSTEAFVPGRWVVVYSSDLAAGRRVQRWGTIPPGAQNEHR